MIAMDAIGEYPPEEVQKQLSKGVTDENEASYAAAKEDRIVQGLSGELGTEDLDPEGAS